MKSVSAALAAHLVGPVTTLATCWRITQTDGREFFFTDHDRDIVFDGDTYRASSGYSRTAIANDASLAVDNLDVESVFDSAEVRVFFVNYDHRAWPSMRPRRERRGYETRP